MHTHATLCIMKRGKRLKRDDMQALEHVPKLAMVRTQQSAMQSRDLIRARRALIAKLLVRRFDIAEITLTLALPIEAGGIGIHVSEATIVRDIGEIRKTWEASAKKSIRTGLIDELAKLEYLDRHVMPNSDTAFDPQRVAASLGISDRRIRLLGLDLETRAKLNISSDGPLVGSDINTVLERARAARKRMQDEQTVDITVSADDNRD